MRAQRSPDGGSPAGAGQPWALQAFENGVNTWYGVPSPFVTDPGPTAYGVPVRTNGSVEGPLDRLVALAAVGAGVRGDVHRRRTELARDLGQHRRRVAVPDDERAVRGPAQRLQRPQQPGDPRCPGRPQQPVVEHEQRQHPTAVGRLRRRVQGGVVGEAQVAPEPQHGVGHAVTLGVRPRARRVGGALAA